MWDLILLFSTSVLPKFTLTVLIVGLALKMRGWMRPGMWFKLENPSLQVAPEFIKSVIRNLILFERIYKHQPVLWLLTFPFHIMTGMVIFGHLRGFGVWSKDILKPLGAELTYFFIKTLPLALGVLMVVLLIGILVYRLSYKPLRTLSSGEDYTVILLVLTILSSGVAMRLLPYTHEPFKVNFLPGVTLYIEETPNIAAFTIHVISSQILIMLLPFGKLVHIVSSLINILYSTSERSKHGGVISL